MAATRLNRTATSISWIPSDSIPSLLRLPFERGLMHFDPPPPLELDDLEGMRRNGHFRFANVVGVWVEVDDGRIVEAGYDGPGLVMGVTPFTIGPMRILLPTKRNPVIRHDPQLDGATATFVQTAGNRPGFSVLRPSRQWPFLKTRPFTIWTTVEVVVSAGGASRARFVGASPFPRHWLYDNESKLAEKSATTRQQFWLRTVFGSHTPWGGEEVEPVVAAPESPVERQLADEIMAGGDRAIRRLQPGEELYRQGEEGSTVALVLDGTFDVSVDGRVVGQIGPGTVIGEKAGLGGAGRRTAGIVAVTDARVAETAPERLSDEALRELALHHARESEDS